MSYFHIKGLLLSEPKGMRNYLKAMFGNKIGKIKKNEWKWREYSKKENTKNKN